MSSQVEISRWIFLFEALGFSAFIPIACFTYMVPLPGVPLCFLAVAILVFLWLLTYTQYE